MSTDHNDNAPDSKEAREAVMKMRLMVEKGQVHTLVPLLPMLLNLDGKPYSLEEHFPFEPLFSVHAPRKLVIMSGRQLGKSSGLSSSGIITSTAIDYFKTLYITPLFEQIRRFSNNYVRPFIEQSPVRSLWTGTNTENSVLQRSFRNYSTMYFSYAFLDADRVRGIKADRCAFDESIAVGTDVNLADGSVKKVEDVNPGDKIFCFDTKGKIYVDSVTKRSFHGTRRCFGIHLADGRKIIATDDSFIATDRGWVRVGEIVRDAWRLFKCLRGIASSFGDNVCTDNQPPGTDGRRPNIRRASRRKARRIRLAKIPGINRVRFIQTRELEEDELSRMANSIANRNLSSLMPYRALVLPDRFSSNSSRQTGSQNNHSGSTGRAKRSGPSVVVHGKPSKNNQPGHTATPQRTAKNPVPRGRLSQLQTETAGKRATQRGTRTQSASIGATTGAHPAVHSTEYAPQVLLKHVPSRGRLPKVSESLSTGGSKNGRQPKSVPISQVLQPLLPESGSKALGNSSGIGPIPYGQPRDPIVGTELLPTEIVAVSYEGVHRVYDLTTAKRHTFFANNIAVHNCQDLNPEFIPIIAETMSHSHYAMSQYTGTPKTRDNTLEGLWLKSSQAEWCIPCMNCKHLNIPVMGLDLEKMIGPWRSDICPENPAVICAKCRLPIQPKIGRWVHRYENRRWDSAGYHIPQIIMPIHYGHRDKWSVLLAKQGGAGNMTVGMFYNEVLGVSYDLATKLISQTDLETAAILHENDEDTAARAAGRYTHRVMGIDWGGGGEDGVSFTTVAVVGLTTHGRLEVIYGKRLLTPHDHFGEAVECLRIFNKFQCDLLAHDYTGAGNMRETFIVQAGLARERVAPLQYVRTASRNILTFVPATIQHPRDYYRLDKARSLQLTCYCIKMGRIVTFKYDHKDDDNPGLLHDFLALIENKVATAHGGDIYTIIKNEAFTDDFAHAVNLACVMVWHMTGTWPVFTEAQGAAGPLNTEQLQSATGIWNPGIDTETMGTIMG